MKNIESIVKGIGKQEQIHSVADFLHLVTTSPVPIEIATRSLGGEKLFVWVNAIRPLEEQGFEAVADAVEELTTIVAYVESNGDLFPANQYGLIAHCDLAFCRKQTGEKYVFTDLKCSPSQYLPPKTVGWTVDAESINWFADSAMCLERRRPMVAGESDPYLIGIGELVFAIGVSVVLKKHISVVKSLFFTKDGRNLWRKYGLIEDDAIVRQLDTVVTYMAVVNTMNKHIHSPY